MTGPARTPAPCSRCGINRPAAISVQGKNICQGCRTRLQRNPGPCPGCQQHRVLAFHDRQKRQICAGCAGEKPTYSCQRCGREDNCYGRNCGPCTLAERATELLTDPDTAQIHQQLQPVFNALMTVDRPQTTLYWFRRSEGPLILHRMATGELQISHKTFQLLPSNKTTNYLRDFLTALGVLPHYEARIERMLPWLEDQLDTIPKADADIVRRFAQWRVLRHLRQKAARDELTKSMVLQGRAQIKGAARFLDWLTRHDTTLTGMGQADLERYLITHPGSETSQHAFIGWVRTSGINTSLRIPKQPRRFSSVTMSEEERWGHVQTLLHDQTMRHYTRIGGLFMLLFAQPLTTICRMHADQVTLTDDGQVTVTFERTPILMPEPLDRIIIEHMNRRGQASYASRNSRWLFPGGIPGNHLATENIRGQLVDRGIKPYNSRKAALFQLAAEIPTPILAELLGISTTTALRWAALSSRNWNAYIAQR